MINFALGFVVTTPSFPTQVRIDHGSKSLSFGQELSFSHKEEAPEGSHVQVRKVLL